MLDHVDLMLRNELDRSREYVSRLLHGAFLNQFSGR
ncbi:hypothetical protein Halar_3597 [halophilic archaeon DL31]|jgi:hypothetical protein|nr:hypothetical protein Halar_3597 [halophilic archaeon DL31]